MPHRSEHTRPPPPPPPAAPGSHPHRPQTTRDLPKGPHLPPPPPPPPHHYHHHYYHTAPPPSHSTNNLMHHPHNEHHHHPHHHHPAVSHRYGPPVPNAPPPSSVTALHQLSGRDVYHHPSPSFHEMNVQEKNLSQPEKEASASREQQGAVGTNIPSTASTGTASPHTIVSHDSIPLKSNTQHDHTSFAQQPQRPSSNNDNRKVEGAEEDENSTKSREADAISALLMASKEMERKETKKAPSPALDHTSVSSNTTGPVIRSGSNLTDRDEETTQPPPERTCSLGDDQSDAHSQSGKDTQQHTGKDRLDIAEGAKGPGLPNNDEGTSSAPPTAKQPQVSTTTRHHHPCHVSPNSISSYGGADHTGTSNGSAPEPNLVTPGAHRRPSYEIKHRSGDALDNSKEVISEFPSTLHALLCTPEHHTVIQWLHHGMSWKIVRWDALRRVLPLYFPKLVEGGDNSGNSGGSLGSIDKFLWHVKAWGFEEITDGPDVGSYHNVLFRRDSAALCSQMQPQHRKSPSGLHSDISKVSSREELPVRGVHKRRDSESTQQSHGSNPLLRVPSLATASNEESPSGAPPPPPSAAQQQDGQRQKATGIAGKEENGDSPGGHYAPLPHPSYTNEHRKSPTWFGQHHPPPPPGHRDDHGAWQGQHQPAPPLHHLHPDHRQRAWFPYGGGTEHRPHHYGPPLPPRQQGPPTVKSSHVKSGRGGARTANQGPATVSKSSHVKSGRGGARILAAGSTVAGDKATSNQGNSIPVDKGSSSQSSAKAVLTEANSKGIVSTSRRGRGRPLPTRSNRLTSNLPVETTATAGVKREEPGGNRQQANITLGKLDGKAPIGLAKQNQPQSPPEAGVAMAISRKTKRPKITQQESADGQQS